MHCFSFQQLWVMLINLNSLVPELQALRKDLDAGKELGIPDGVLINGKGPYRYSNTLVRGGIDHETIKVEPGNVAFK